MLTSQRHSPWFTLHEKPGSWNHCQPSSNGNVKRLLWQRFLKSAVFSIYSLSHPRKVAGRLKNGPERL